MTTPAKPETFSYEETPQIALAGLPAEERATLLAEAKAKSDESLAQLRAKGAKKR